MSRIVIVILIYHCQEPVHLTHTDFCFQNHMQNYGNYSLALLPFINLDNDL
jgi:hypothetical protein